MLNPKIEAEVIKNDVVSNITRCPVCSSFSTHLHYMRDSDTRLESKWYQCHCGTIWQKDRALDKYDEAYYNKFDGSYKVDDSINYAPKIYLPIIEEMMYGRKVLHVSYLNGVQMNPFRERGWIIESLDKVSEKSDIICDAEEYECKKKYNLIWLPMVLECFTKPLETLVRLRDMLEEDGIIFIETPDTDFLSIRSPSGFVHWKKEYNNVMWSREKLIEYLKQIGFDVVLSRRNCEQRFLFTDTTHIIAQKRFY